MKQVQLADSFLDDDKELSLYDVVFPIFKMQADGTPEMLLGSCFPIGIGIYATAAHIFDPFMQARNRYKGLDPKKEALSLEEKLDRQRDMIDHRLFEGVDVNCGALVLDQSAIREEKYVALGFSLVRYVVVFLDDDLALLFLHEDRRRNAQSSSLPITCLPLVETPVVGGEIIVAGFPGKSNRFEAKVVDGKLDFTAWIGLVASEGTITAMHEVKRDEGQCFFPCLETTASMAPGHSGGPAISRDNWGVVGVNSAGLNTQGYSVVSWIGKALDVNFTLPFALTLGQETVPPEEPISLRRMADAEVIQIVRCDRDDSNKPSDEGTAN